MSIRSQDKRRRREKRAYRPRAVAQTLRPLATAEQEPAAPAPSAPDRYVPPDFGVAELRAFDPRIFDSEVPFDRFMLMLARIFNDGKVIHWVGKQMAKATPPAKVGAYEAQVAGFNNWIAKSAVSLLREFIELVEQQNDVVKGEGFQHLLASLPPKIQLRWNAFVGVAQKNAKGTIADELSTYLERVRHGVGYHYYNPKALGQGYQSFFFGTALNEYNAHALASIGDSLEQTGFFFADAALQGYLTTVVDSDGSNAKYAGQLLEAVMIALLFTVEAYLEMKAKELSDESVTNTSVTVD